MKNPISARTSIRLFFCAVAMLAATFVVQAQTADNSAPPTDGNANGVGAQHSSEQHGFFSRFAKAYSDDWKGVDDSEEPKRRGFPAPVASPPYPFADWPYGGSPVIGVQDSAGGPLMTAIYGGEHADWWQSSRVKIYGWINGGFNVSTSDKHYGNAPAAYYIQPNSVQLDQAALYIERVPDSVQTDHFDWGFRLTQLYGVDYRFTTANGYFSQQLLERNNKYGYDPVMAYVDLYWGQVANGMNVRIGRYISLPDIEAQLAPDNYTYSHSILYTFDAYTQTGINVTTRLNNHWMFQVGLSAGNDVAPWVGEPNAKPTFNACVGYTWTEGRDNLYICDNSTNSGKYAYNNLQAYYATWYHKFGDSSWHTATEIWYMWEKDVPNVNSPAAAPLFVTGGNGAICASEQDVTCYAPEWAMVNYVEKQITPHDYLSIRNEYFNDIRGQRTGYKTQYSEHLIGWGHWIGSTVLIRPELRFEHSYDAPAYNLGTKKSQFVFASDVIYHF